MSRTSLCVAGEGSSALHGGERDLHGRGAGRVDGEALASVLFNQVTMFTECIQALLAFFLRREKKPYGEISALDFYLDLALDL